MVSRTADRDTHARTPPPGRARVGPGGAAFPSRARDSLLLAADPVCSFVSGVLGTDLGMLTTRELLSRIIDKCGAKGILVCLDNHRLTEDYQSPLVSICSQQVWGREG